MSKEVSELSAMDEIVIRFDEALEAGNFDEARKQALYMQTYSPEDSVKMVLVYLRKKREGTRLEIDFSNWL